MQFFTYIMASGRNGTLYVGMTNDLVRGTWEHRKYRIETANPGGKNPYPDIAGV